MTGHGNMGCHLRKIGKSQSSFCPGCQQLDDPMHRIYECPVFDAARRTLAGECADWHILFFFLFSMFLTEKFLTTTYLFNVHSFFQFDVE
jgi:hypothetical protein